MKQIVLIQYFDCNIVESLTSKEVPTNFSKKYQSLLFLTYVMCISFVFGEDLQKLYYTDILKIDSITLLIIYPPYLIKVTFF